MKRIGVLVSVAALFLACVVPAGAYQWNGDSFLDDYYGATLLDAEFDAGHFELGPLVGAKISVSGDHTGSYTINEFTQLVDLGSLYLFVRRAVSVIFSDVASAPFGTFTWRASYTSCSVDFVFDAPVDSFLLDGDLSVYLDLRPNYYNSSGGSFATSVPFSTGSVEFLVDGSVIKSFSDLDLSYSHFLDLSDLYYSSDTPISKFTIRFYPSSDQVSQTLSDLRFRGSFLYLFFRSSTSNPFSVSVNVPDPGPVDPDPPGPVDPDPPGPVVPGEGDFEYTEISGAELAKDMVLGPNVATGGANVYWIYDSYETGVPPYEVTVPGGAAHQMAPARFPSISLSKSEATVTASIPSTSYTFSWEGGCRVERFESLLTGPPGFSGPGSSALDYVELQIPISSEEPVHNFDLTGAVPVETVYRAGSRSVTRVGGAWSLYVNGALVTFGTTDTYGNIQFNGFVYHSSEPITAITLRLVPTAAGLAFPSNTGRITFSWSMSLDFKDLSMVYLEGEDEAIDLDKFYQQVSDSQGSIDSYDKIESQWTDNMTSNWDALKLDEFSFDAGLISGFALLSGIFNDIWRAFGLFNVVWIAPLMLGISMLVIGRISRDGGKGKGSG